MERRLVAILAADVVGYSRLMEAGEEATASALNACRKIIDRLVGDHRGRVFGSAGDSVLAEFTSPVEAVRCAVNIQREIGARNDDLPEDRRMRLRVGVNLGDVIVDGDNLLGDGVNIAARLESLADTGGICLSRPVFDQIKKRLDLGYEDLGEHEVKNIAEPVRVYRVLTDPEAAGKVLGATKPATQSWRRLALAAAVVALVGLAGAALWLRPWAPTIEPTSVERMAFPLPDKPSIAVLPFVNMSDDPNQEYFADGIAEDLITDLSKISGLFVIARNSAFSYKGRNVKVRQVAEDLGVRYVLEGSVRRAGERVRINAQLIDATTGGHLWAERYDGSLADVFGVQDDVARRIVAALKVELTAADEKALERETRPVDLEAYDWLLKGRRQLADLDREKAALAKVYFERAIEADPSYARAHTNLGFYYLNQWRLWGRDRTKNVEIALRTGRQAAELDPQSAGARVLLALAHQFRGEHDEADRWGDEALNLHPTQAETLGNLGAYMRQANRYAEAVEVLEKAMRLDPLHPPSWLSWLGLAYFYLGETRKAIEVLREGVAREPGYIAFHVFLTASYVAAGELEKAEAAGREVLRLNDRFTVSAMERFASAFTKDASYVRYLGAALRKAGLPE